MANFIFQVVKLSATGTRTTLSWNQRQILPHSKRTLFWANSIHMTKSASKLTAWHATQQDCDMCKQDCDWFKGLLCPDKHPMSTHTCAHHLGWAGMVWDHEFFSPFQIKIVLVWHSCVSTTFIVVMSISSLVVVLSALLYPGRRVATSSPPSPPFPLGWLGLFPGPKVAKLPQPPHFIFHPFHKSSCCHHGAKFSAASTNHFHLLHKSSCCKHHPAPPDYGMPPWDLLPPSAGPLRRGHFVWVFPSQSLPSLVYFPGELVASSLVGWRLRSAPPCMVIVSLPTKSWFHFLVLKQS